MPRPCRVGLLLPEDERRVGWPELIRMARRAEAAGFDSLWVGDHLLFEYPGGVVRGPWEAWTSLAALAAVTERVQLGPLVTAAGFRAPALLAKQAATVDAISGGRLVLGLGAGWNEREFRAYGLPFDNRVARFAEAFTIVRTLLREGRADVAGTYHSVEKCVLDPGPVRPGGPPLLIGSTGARMLRITLPHVDAWNLWFTDYGNTAEGYAAARDRMHEAIRAAGRDPADLDATAAVLVHLPGATGAATADPDLPQVTPVRGDATAIAAHLAALAAAGAAHLQLVVDPITEESIDTLAGVLAVLES